MFTYLLASCSRWILSRRNILIQTTSDEQYGGTSLLSGWGWGNIRICVHASSQPTDTTLILTWPSEIHVGDIIVYRQPSYTNSQIKRQWSTGRVQFFFMGVFFNTYLLPRGVEIFEALVRRLINRKAHQGNRTRVPRCPDHKDDAFSDSSTRTSGISSYTSCLTLFKPWR